MNIFKQVQWRHLFVVVLLISMALVPYLVFAQDLGNEFNVGYSESSASGDINTKSLFTILGDSAGYKTGQENSVGSVVAAVINGVLSIIGVIFLIEMFYAGYLWMTAQGNEEQVTKAKSLIRQAIIGVIVIVAAYAIVYFVLAALLEVDGGGGGSGGLITTP